MNCKKKTGPSKYYAGPVPTMYKILGNMETLMARRGELQTVLIRELPCLLLRCITVIYIKCQLN